MSILRSEGIVLRSLDLGEKDKIVIFFTKDFGKLHGVAAGARNIINKYGVGIEPLSYVRVIFFEREQSSLVRINETDTIESFFYTFDDFKKGLYGLYILELIDIAMREREKNDTLFKCTIDTLSFINTHRFTETIIRIFELKLLSLAGFMPHVDGCTMCNADLKGSGNGFSCLRSGLICKSCAKNIKDFSPLDPGVIRFLIKSIHADMLKSFRLQLDKTSHIRLREIIFQYIAFCLGKEPRSLRMLRVFNRQPLCKGTGGGMG